MQDIYKYMWSGLAQSLLLLATVWTVRGSNPSMGEIFSTCPDCPRAHPAPYTVGTGSLSRE